MCNSYRIGQARDAETGLRAKIAAAAAKLPSSLVRKSDPGIVIPSPEAVEIMRWGFSRSFNPSINNARSDKLGSSLWAEAFHKRRCVIPISEFYEWGPGSGGRKQAHCFRDPDGDYLWIAGLWEPNSEFGPCCTMITTTAPPLMAPIHDRMPAILRTAELDGFLGGDDWLFQPFRGPLQVSACESPLKQKPSSEAESQGELF